MLEWNNELVCSGGSPNFKKKKKRSSLLLFLYNCFWRVEHSLTPGMSVISLPLPHLHCITFYFGNHQPSFPPGTCVEENSGCDNRNNVHLSWVERQFQVAIIMTHIVQDLWTTDNALGVTKSLNSRLPNLQPMSETLWPVLACPLEWKTQEDTSYFLTQSPGDLGTLP